MRNYISKITICFVLIINWHAVIAKTFTVGTISASPASDIALFQPLANYIAKHLAPFGYGGGNVAVASSISELSNMILADRVDIYIDSPSPIVRISSKTGCVIFLRRWKEHTANYQSIIFVKNDSQIKDVKDLKGKLIAFEQPFSTSGFAFPLEYLQHKGLTVTEDNSTPKDKMATNVRYVFSEDDQNTMVWVLEDKTNAGAMRLSKFEDFLKKNPVVQKQLRIIFKSIPVPRHLVCYRKGIDTPIVNQLTAILTGMSEDPEGRKILDDMENTTKFDIYPGDNPEHKATLQQLIKIYQLK